MTTSTPSTTTRYREHLTAIPPTIMRYLVNASLKQVPAQGRVQNGDEDQKRMNQQQGPATQQGRSTRHAIRHLITHPRRHHNTRSLERWGDYRQTNIVGRKIKMSTR